MTTLSRVLVFYDGRDEDARTIGGVVDRAIGNQSTGSVSLVDVAEVPVQDCCGCFRCWVRTPGLCVLRGDEGNTLCRRVLEARAVVIVSRIRWGGYSAAIKTVADRTLPLLHPDFRRVNGAMHHRMRYSRMPQLLAVGYGARHAAEEETFFRYTEAHRINFGVPHDRSRNSTPFTTIWRGDAGSVGSWLTAAIGDELTEVPAC